MSEPQYGQVWRHVKTGADYLILHAAISCIEGCKNDPMIVYQSVAKGAVFVRTLADFLLKFLPVDSVFKSIEGGSDE